MGGEVTDIRSDTAWTDLQARLRAAGDAANEAINAVGDMQAEIERLRGLLREVWDAAPYLGVDINRRVMKALGDVPDA
jgi:hypothetical protein